MLSSREFLSLFCEPIIVSSIFCKNRTGIARRKKKAFISDMGQKGKASSEIAEIMLCFLNMVYNALIQQKKRPIKEANKKISRKPRPRKKPILLSQQDKLYRS